MISNKAIGKCIIWTIAQYSFHVVTVMFSIEEQTSCQWFMFTILYCSQDSLFHEQAVLPCTNPQSHAYFFGLSLRFLLHSPQMTLVVWVALFTFLHLPQIPLDLRQHLSLKLCCKIVWQSRQTVRLLVLVHMLILSEIVVYIVVFRTWWCLVCCLREDWLRLDWWDRGLYTSKSTYLSICLHHGFEGLGWFTL